MTFEIRRVRNGALLRVEPETPDELESGGTPMYAHLFTAEGMPAFAGWIVPVEPLLAPLRERPACQAILDKLAARAR